MYGFQSEGIVCLFARSKRTLEQCYFSLMRAGKGRGRERKGGERKAEREGERKAETEGEEKGQNVSKEG